MRLSKAQPRLWHTCWSEGALSSVIISSTVLEAIGIAGVHSSVERNGLEVVLFCDRKFGDFYENIVCGLHDSARELGMAVSFLVLGVVVNSVGDDTVCCINFAAIPVVLLLLMIKLK